MKVAFVFLVFTALATFAIADEPVGHFQLFSGTLGVESKAGIISTTPVILRIDTKTGKTWQYISVQNEKGRYIEYWSEVAEHVPSE
jgi:hypothetical protein